VFIECPPVLFTKLRVKPSEQPESTCCELYQQNKIPHKTEWFIQWLPTFGISCIPITIDNLFSDSKSNVVIMDKKSNKVKYFWNLYPNAGLEWEVPELRRFPRNSSSSLSFGSCEILVDGGQVV
jgi:hypothetical protein